MNAQNRTAFGIDFGTTNTRIVYYDGRELFPIQLEDNEGRIVYNIPSVVGYERGKAEAFGYDALSSGLTLCESIKWLLNKDYPVEVDGGFVEPTKIVADFFKYLKTVVREASSRGYSFPDLAKASLSFPVEYTPDDRQALCKACEMAGIEVESIFPEPVSALYSSIVSDRRPGIIGVFDWGGGTLDITTVKLDSEYVQVLKTAGMKKAGDDFDQIILDNALPYFISEAQKYESGLSPKVIGKYFKNDEVKNRLKRKAEQRKIHLSYNREASISESFGAKSHPLRYSFTRDELNSWIEPIIQEGIDRLYECIEKAGVVSVHRIIMSGGTCNIPAVQMRLKDEFGPDCVDTPRPIERGFSMRNDTGIGTAEGAALLTVHGGKPVFSKDMGIFLVNPIDRTDVYFRPIYRKNDSARVNEKKQKSFVVTNANQEEINLLIGDSPENIVGQVDIPINRREELIDVTFSIDKYLVMKAEGIGRKFSLQGSKSKCLILDIPLAFKIPTPNIKRRWV